MFLLKICFIDDRTLLNSMKTWKESGLLNVVYEKIIILNDPMPEEVAISLQYGFRIVEPKTISNAKVFIKQKYFVGYCIETLHLCSDIKIKRFHNRSFILLRIAIDQHRVRHYYILRISFIIYSHSISYLLFLENDFKMDTSVSVETLQVQVYKTFTATFTINIYIRKNYWLVLEC